MKNFISAAVCFIILLVSATTFANEYCTGWAEGFKAGYCYGKYSCISPIIPICPIPRIGEMSFQDGYNRGFLAGLNAR